MKTTRCLFSILLLVSLGVFSVADDKKPQAGEIKPFPKALVQSVWVQTIWADGQHNGFPGIARVGDFYYVAFRQAESHQAKTAKIVVIRSGAKD